MSFRSILHGNYIIICTFCRHQVRLINVSAIKIYFSWNFLIATQQVEVLFETLIRTCGNSR